MIELKELNKKCFDISFVIPIFNEVQSLELLLECIEKIDSYLIGNDFVKRHEYILVDDGSTDGTGAFIRSQIALKKSHTDVILGSHDMNFGYGAAIQSGIHMAKYDWILTFDADDQHNCDSILNIVERLITTDHTILLIGSRDPNSPLTLRSIGKRLLNWSEVLFLKSKLIDSNSGLKCFKKDVYIELDKIIPAPVDMSFSQHVAQTFYALSTTLVEEVSIEIQDRKNGNSKIHLKDFFIALRQNLTLAYSLKSKRFYYIFSILIFLVAIPYSVIVIAINKSGMPVAGGIAIAIGFSFVALGELRQAEREQKLLRLKNIIRINYFFKVFKNR